MQSKTDSKNAEGREESTDRRIERRNFFKRNNERPLLCILRRLDDVEDDKSMLFALDDEGRVVEFLCSDESLDWTDFLGRPLSDFAEIDWHETSRYVQDSHALERVGIARLKGLDRPCFASLQLRRAKGISGKRGKPLMQLRGTSDARLLSLDVLAGADPGLKRQVSTIKRLANRRLPILLQGETGTGKEEFARAIHGFSSWSSGPFVAIDCSSIPESLFESELFGYETGTFTGGRREGRRGRFVDAHNGTLFLDEIGDMPLALQTRLLRVLAQREVVPLGGAKPIAVDFDLICASHQDLPKLVEDGRFRQDLFFRIAGLRIALPPLRDRQDKERIIGQAFAIEAIEMGLTPAPTISTTALRVLMAYTWPGNIRELRLAARYALANAMLCEIHPNDLPSWLCPRGAGTRESVSEPSCAGESILASELVTVLEQHSWCISDAAASLKINRRTLYRWMRRHSIARPNQS